MAWRRSGDKPLSWWLVYLGVYASLGLNELNSLLSTAYLISTVYLYFCIKLPESPDTWWLEIFIQFTIQNVEHICIVSNLEATSRFGNCLYQSVIMWFLSCDSQTIRKPFWHLHDTFWCSCISILKFTKTCTGNKIIQIKPINSPGPTNIHSSSV